MKNFTEDLVPRLAPLQLRVTPLGHLLVLAHPEGALMDAALVERVEATFENGAGYGLLMLGVREVGKVMSLALGWWREFAAHYLSVACSLPEGSQQAAPLPSEFDLNVWLNDSPPMHGGEYLTTKVLSDLWRQIDNALLNTLAENMQTLEAFLREHNSPWNLVGRVHFNLAEIKGEDELPFAFMATYTTKVSTNGRALHQQLSHALEEYSGGKNTDKLLSLLTPVQRASAECKWLAKMVEKREIFRPVKWSSSQAFQFLSDIPKLIAAGVIIRTPKIWGSVTPSRVTVRAVIGSKQPKLLGQDALLDFNVAVCVGEETLSAQELSQLLKANESLQMIRGRWVEINTEAVKKLLERFKEIKKEASKLGGGIDYLQGMRLLAKASLQDDVTPVDSDWSECVAGPWLSKTLRDLRTPQGLVQVLPGNSLKATLRPYQEQGVRWLYLLTRLGLGACLADDMGLGKTIQVLALLLLLRDEEKSVKFCKPSILVAPASLLSNWFSEATKFAPSLRVLVVHPSSLSATDFKTMSDNDLSSYDLVITSFGTLLRQDRLLGVSWRVAIVDEAQALKNSVAKQTKRVKKLKARTRIALSGTPVENRLEDLWSLFDFTSPGLLGTEKEFANFCKKLQTTEHFAPIRNLVRPYILRRHKTDKTVINDLPDKLEMKVWCHLSAAQSLLYKQSVNELAEGLQVSDGIRRRGLVLSYLMRFKQICNHPSQWLTDGQWRAGDSGKFARLGELAEVIAAKQEKVLVFTQFRETTEPLAAFLGSVFGRSGLVLHGGTSVGQRKEIVKRFQEDELVPFLVLSLKAGGSGLNLTAASHVIHFDRWWNPSVENQATDRAFRIGQVKNVIVHKFVCRGTVEERIDQLIESKQKLVTDVLEGGVEIKLTEMSDQELLSLVKLDIHSAQEN